MEKVTNQEIADYIDKSKNTVDGWKGKFPKLLELVKVGAFCKKNNITMDMIKNCIELKKLSQEQGK